MVHYAAVDEFKGTLWEMSLSRLLNRIALYTVMSLALLVAADIASVSFAQETPQQYSTAMERQYNYEHRISMMEANLDTLKWTMGFVLTGVITLVGELILRMVRRKDQE